MTLRHSPHKLTVYRAYLVRTTAGRELHVLFKGHTPTRLWFLNLDAPYEDILLKSRHIKKVTPV